MQMLPPLLYLVLLFGLLFCFPLGVFLVPMVVPSVPSRFMRKIVASCIMGTQHSYGVFAMSLKTEQYKGIFESYCEEILRRKREEQAWLRSAPAAKSKRPGMWEDI